LPVFEKHNKFVLYIHVPKTGGTAIDNFFAVNGFRCAYLDIGGAGSLNGIRRCAPQHMHAETLSMLLRPNRFDFVFMTVRHPLARIISEYRMLLRTKQGVPSLGQWLDKVFQYYPEDHYIGENHIRPQSQFWLAGCDVFKQEDGYGENLVSRIEERLSMALETRRIDSLVAADPTRLPADEVERIRPRVEQFYREDYRFFGY
jgi:hypothetical protein